MGDKQALTMGLAIVFDRNPLYIKIPLEFGDRLASSRRMNLEKGDHAS
jgi:hypothetical protein